VASFPRMSRGEIAPCLMVAACLQCAPTAAAAPRGGLSPRASAPSAAVVEAPRPVVAPAPLAAASELGVSAPQLVAPTHLEGTRHLEPFFRALSALEDGRAADDVHILQFGDSHTAGDMGVSVFRRTLQERFGDGGRGFVAIGKPWRGYWQSGIRVGMSKDFRAIKAMAKGPAPDADGAFGLAGVRVDAVRADARAWTEVSVPFSRAEIDYWQGPRGGTFEVLVDHLETARVASRSSHAGSGFFPIEVSEAPHTIEVRAVGDGPVRLFGMALDRAQRGVVVDTLGIVGAQIFTPLRWSEEHFAEQLSRRTPDLVVLAYGTNEAVAEGLTDARYERGLTELAARVARAAPNASCLFLGPPDLARQNEDTGEWATLPRLLEIIAIQRRVAEANGCAFYDQFEAMGGAGSMSAWADEPEPRALKDHIHLKPSGYAEIATAFAGDLMRGYDRWRQEQGAPLEVPASAAR
jgi:lysophospholipase L1-like esterase